MSAQTKLECGLAGTMPVIRIIGRATFVCTLDFRELVGRWLERGHERVCVDLSQAPIVDSTFLGALAGFVLPNPGKAAARNIILYNAGERVLDILRTFEIEHLFDLKNGPPLTLSVSQETFFSESPARERKRDYAGAALESHEALAKLSPKKAPELEAVAKLLEEEQADGEDSFGPSAREVLAVFISAKSEDYGYAFKVYDFLRARGVSCFFSQESLSRVGQSRYKAVIDNAIETARHMVVVTSSRKNVESKWVNYEWDSFAHEQLSGRKDGNLVTVLCGSMRLEELPLALRQNQAFKLKDGLEYLPSYLGDKTPVVGRRRRIRFVSALFGWLPEKRGWKWVLLWMLASSVPTLLIYITPFLVRINVPESYAWVRGMFWLIPFSLGLLVAVPVQRRLLRAHFLVPRTWGLWVLLAFVIPFALSRSRWFVDMLWHVVPSGMERRFGAELIYEIIASAFIWFVPLIALRRVLPQAWLLWRYWVFGNVPLRIFMWVTIGWLIEESDGSLEARNLIPFIATMATVLPANFIYACGMYRRLPPRQP